MRKHPSDDCFDIEAVLDEPVRYLHEGCESSSKGYTDKALVVIRRETGWGYRCHRCGLSGFKPYKNLTPSQVARLYEQQKNATSGKALRERRALPRDYKRVLPSKAMVWLMKCITFDEIQEYGIGWSDELDRIIFPIYTGTELVGYCARSLNDGPNCPKYLTVTFDPNAGHRIFFNVIRDSPYVVLVEDILSAIVVGRQVNTVALLGCFIPPHLVETYKDKRIFFWLDSNKLAESLRFRNNFNSMGFDVRTVLSYTDPKYQTQEDITDFLGLEKGVFLPSPMHYGLDTEVSICQDL